jgi:hypothetical protein
MLTAALFGLALTAAIPTEGRVAFDVLRNGQPIGSHVVNFTTEADGARRADVAIDLSVSLGPVRVFSYTHRCTERWSAEGLLSARCETNRNGRRTTMTAARSGANVQVTGTKFTGAVPVGTPLSSYWRNDIDGAQTMVNTENGELIPIRTALSERADGQACVEVTATVPLQLCYDARGVWSGTAFRLDGGEFTYRRAQPNVMRARSG